jgi:hypothetical protein
MLDANLIEECGKCGSHTIIDEVDYMGGGHRETHRKCFNCGSRNIKLFEKPAVVQPPMEETMSSKDKSKNLCSYPGCNNWGSFDKMCAAHFREAHNMSYKEYCTRRKNGETKEEIFESTPYDAPPPNPNVQPNIKKKNHHLLHEKIKAMTDAGVQSVRESYVSAGLPYPANIIHVDFTGHEDLLKNFEKSAALDFRTVPQQILWLVDWADRKARPIQADPGA